MADGMSTGPSYGSGKNAYTTLLGGRKKINKVASGNKRYGKAYTTVRRADGMVGHRYDDGRVVWVKKKGVSPAGGAGYGS